MKAYLRSAASRTRWTCCFDRISFEPLRWVLVLMDNRWRNPSPGKFLQWARRLTVFGDSRAVEAYTMSNRYKCVCLLQVVRSRHKMPRYAKKAGERFKA